MLPHSLQRGKTSYHPWSSSFFKEMNQEIKRKKEREQEEEWGRKNPKIQVNGLQNGAGAMANDGGRGGSFSLASWRGHCSSVSFSDSSPVPYLICEFTIQKSRLSREVQYHGQLHDLYHGLWRYTECAVVLHKWCSLPKFWFILPSYSYGGWLGKIISMLQLN